MRKLLTSMLTLTLVFGSVMATPVMAEDNSGEVTQTKIIYVSYIDENGAPIENAVIEQVVVPADALYFNSSLLKQIPAGYELPNGVGDILCGNDTINVTLTKATSKTIYVSYIDENGTPIEGSVIEQVVVPADALYFSSSLLKQIPDGYTYPLGVGDILCGNGTINVTLSKVTSKTIYVSYIDENGAPIEGSVIEQVEVPYDATYFSSSLLKQIPDGYTYPLGVGDILCGNGTINVTLKKLTSKTIYVSYIDENGAPIEGSVIEQVEVPYDATYFNSSLLKQIPDGYTYPLGVGDILCGNGTINVTLKKVTSKTIYVSYIDESGAPIEGSVIEQVEVPYNATYFNSSLLKQIPNGYEYPLGVGDILCGNGTINVTLRKISSKAVYVSYIDSETKMPLKNAIETIKIGANDTTFHSSLLKAIPAGYKLAYGVGDIYVGEGDSVNVEVTELAENEKTVYVSYIDEETKMPLENAIEIIVIGAKDTTFNASILKAVPAGYELAQVGDVYVGAGDTVNVEVRKVAEAKTIYVSYINEADKTPLENGIEAITVKADATFFNTSILKEVPVGFELVLTGDIYFGENDTVNVEVRKVAETKTVYVSYINEADKTPFENGIEKITVKADATYFNTSILKEVPAGYELVLTGDIYFGENDTVNVEVRKVTTPSKPQEDSKPSTGASSNSKDDKKHVATVANPLPGSNYTYVVPNTATK